MLGAHQLLAACAHTRCLLQSRRAALRSWLFARKMLPAMARAVCAHVTCMHATCWKLEASLLLIASLLQCTQTQLLMIDGLVFSCKEFSLCAMHAEYACWHLGVALADRQMQASELAAVLHNHTRCTQHCLQVHSCASTMAESVILHTSMHPLVAWQLSCGVACHAHRISLRQQQQQQASCKLCSLAGNCL